MTRWVPIAAAAVIAISACDRAADPGTQGVNYTVYVPMRDLETNWRGEVTVETSMEPWFAWDEFVEGELASWDGNLRLVRWPSEEVVPGRWTFDVDEARNRGVFSFEPDAPLSPDDGWYALQVRFGGIGIRRGYFGPELFDERFPGGVNHQFHDGWSTTRFYQADYPLFRLSGGAFLAAGEVPASTGFLANVLGGATVTSDVDLTSSFRVLVAGERVACTLEPSALRAGEDFVGLRASCDGPLTEGALVVELDPLPLVSSGGLSVHYCGVGGRSRWEGRVGADPLLNGPCDDAALLDIPPSDAR
ncbi:MAG: hypothetical protein K1X94_08910 [Sandaracinaceae bacterium]|nr:hypothetical protein [Sandaracinaceae bacterium]